MRRREFLSAAAVGVAGGLAAKPVVALTLETMSVPTAAAYAQRCQIDTTHATLIQEARDRLAADSNAASKAAKVALEDLAQELKQAMTCPFCGCNLALDGSDQSPPPRF